MDSRRGNGARLLGRNRPETLPWHVAAMDQAPAKFDYLAWWTSIPGIPAGWPEPASNRSRVIALRHNNTPPEPAESADYSAAA